MTDKRIIFLHIPKNGGTTLHAILSRYYKEENTFTILTKNSKTLTTQDFMNVPDDEREGIKLLKGHMSFGLHSHLPPPVDYITFLRRPVDRVISYYYYVLSREGHHVGELIEKNKWSLHDFVLNIQQGDVHNAQVRMISGINDSGENMLEKALENIDKHFAMVGMLEEFDKSLILLKHILGTKTPYYQVMKKGSNKPKKREFDQNTLDLIINKNQADIQLYDIMEQKFQNQLKKVPNLSADLLKLQALNKFYSVYKQNNISQFLKKWHLYPSENPFRS